MGDSTDEQSNGEDIAPADESEEEPVDEDPPGEEDPEEDLLTHLGLHTDLVDRTPISYAYMNCPYW